MNERMPDSPAPQPDAKVFYLGQYVAKMLRHVDRQQKRDSLKQYDDDRIVRMNNRYAEEGLPLKPGNKPAKRRQVLILDEQLIFSTDEPDSVSFYPTPEPHEYPDEYDEIEGDNL